MVTVLRNPVVRVAKNTVALVIGRASGMAFTLVFVLYAARLLGVEGFGKYALVMGYYDLFLSLCAAGLSILITREIAKQPSNANEFITAAIVLVTVVSVVASGAMILLAHIIGYAPDTRMAVYMACVALLPGTNSRIFDAAFVAFEKAEYVTYGTVLGNALSSGFGLLALFLGYGLWVLFVILIVTQTSELAFSIAFLNRRVVKLHWQLRWPFLRRLVRDWRVFAAENWLSNLFGSLDVIVLSFFRGAGAVGVYAAASKILRLGSVIAVSYTAAILPYMSLLFEESKETFQRVVEVSVKYMLALVLPGVVTIAILADRIILLLYTNEYAESIAILRILTWILLLRFLNPFLSNVLFARGEQKYSLEVSAVSFAFYLVVSLWFTSRWGALGAAWALLMAVWMASCLYFAFVFRREEAIQTLLALGRTALAAVGLSMLLLVLRDTPLIPLLLSSWVLYAVFLFILRVPLSSDLAVLRGPF